MFIKWTNYPSVLIIISPPGEPSGRHLPPDKVSVPFSRSSHSLSSNTPARVDKERGKHDPAEGSPVSVRLLLISLDKYPSRFSARKGVTTT